MSIPAHLCIWKFSPQDGPKRAKISVLDQKYLFLAEIFLSIIRGPPLNGSTKKIGKL